MTDISRWHAVITYAANAGPVEVEHDIEELEDLHDLVERGPDWNTIQDIRITLQRTTGRLTLEGADND